MGPGHTRKLPLPLLLPLSLLPLRLLLLHLLLMPLQVPYCTIAGPRSTA